MDIFNKLQNIDRRVLYLLIAVVIGVPLVLRPSQHPHMIFDEVRNAYKTINDVPDDKIVLVSIVWGPGTIAENGPQTEVLMRHMFQHNIKFAVVSWDPTGTKITYDMGKQLEKEYHKQYGKDWVHLGYKLFYPQAVVRGMAINFPSIVKNDIDHTPTKKLPVIAKVRGSQDIGAVVEITPSGTVESWISYFTGPYDVPLVYCPTAVMAAEAYPFLDSGQVDGMLNGVIGAVQYETLIGRGNLKTDAAATSWALSTAHIFIILLIIVGNLAFLASKRSSRRGRGR